MLLRLILFVALVGVAWAGAAWWRRSRALGDGGAEGMLGMREFDQLRKLSKLHPRIEQAIKLRLNIVSITPKPQQLETSIKVDAALRRLKEQITLRTRVNEALASIDRERLAREAKGAEAQAADASEDDPVHGISAQLNLQLEQVERLEARSKALDQGADRILLLLRNLNLALLESASSKATEGDKVSQMLADLEDEGDTLRRTTEAEEEVARLLRTRADAGQISA